MSYMFTMSSLLELRDLLKLLSLFSCVAPLHNLGWDEEGRDYGL